MGININNFQYVELNQSGISQEVLQAFDCSNEDMSDYLHNQAKQDAIAGKCVTYILITNSKDRIYAYASISAHGLYYYEDAEKFHTSQSIDGKVILSIPSIELKMFAISKGLRGQIAFLLDPTYQRHYSTIFFQQLLGDLYYMAMTTIGFQMIFLRANNE